MKCPGFEQLIDYCDGLLGDRDAQLIAEHLASGCQHCTDDCQRYERMRAIAASTVSAEPPTWVLKRAFKLLDRNPERSNAVDGLGRLIASLMFDSLSQSALAGVRLAEITDRQLLYRAGNYSIDLQIALSSQSKVDLTGQVLRENEFKFDSVAGISLELVRKGEKVRSTVANEFGEFTIKALELDEYDLLIETREGIITVPRLPITPP